MPRDRLAKDKGSQRCPFLKAVDALTCQLSTVKKFVLDSAVNEAEQRCSSPAWRSCPLLPPGAAVDVDRADCPHLRRVRVQRCAASPRQLMIPGGDHLPSRCAGPSHRYCSLYLERIQPHPDPRMVEMGAFPRGRALAPNHMWLDVHADGSCHLGVDAFLVRVVGTVERVTFGPVRRLARPSVVLKLPVGLELPLVFPHPVDVEATNAELRRRPDALVSDPYGRGWLYEGRVPRGAVPEALRRGAEARDWLGSELRRLTELVHQLIAHRGGDLGPTLADGGRFDDGLARQLDRAELLQIFVAFFAG